jgi:hypothetical protein
LVTRYRGGCPTCWLEGTHAFLGDRFSEARPNRGFFHQIYIAAEKGGQVFPECFKLAEVIEAAPRKAGSGSNRQIDIRRSRCLIAGERAEQGYALDPAYPQVRFMAAQNRQQFGTRSRCIAHPAYVSETGLGREGAQSAGSDALS